MSANSKTSTVAKAAGSIGLAAAACAACCAPLVAPWVVGIVAAGGAGLALAGQIGVAVAIAGGGAFHLWRAGRRRAAAAARLNECRCSTATPAEVKRKPGA